MSKRVAELLGRLWSEDSELGEWHRAQVAAEWLRGCGITHPSQLWIGFEPEPAQQPPLTLVAVQDAVAKDRRG
jgi:hypothetical protein